jgi:hypothetical protein
MGSYEMLLTPLLTGELLQLTLLLLLLLEKAECFVAYMHTLLMYYTV